MTIKSAEHLTGYEIRKFPPERGFVTFGAFNNGELVVKASGRVEWIALRTIVQRVYVLHSRIAMQQSDWRCVHAAVLGGLCSRTIASIGRTVEPTGSIILNRSAGIVTGSFISWSGPWI